MSKIDLLNEARLGWLHQLLPTVNGRPIAFKTVNGKLRALVDINLEDLQMYLSFIQREFDVEFEAYTTSGHLIPLEYSKELAVKAFLDHSPLGNNPIPALFSQNETCPPTFTMFRNKVGEQLRKMSRQLKEEAGMRSFHINESHDWSWQPNGKRVYTIKYGISFDGRQTKRYEGLREKYPLPKYNYYATSMNMEDAVNLLQKSNSLTQEEKNEYRVFFDLLQKWGITQ
jgi:hypothetical protein